MEILQNDKKLLGGYEADIAIPSLGLAIEWNGIVHFEPIYGSDKLKAIKRIDQTKVAVAAERDILLIVIPDLVSTDAYVRESFGEIAKLIRSLTEGEGIEPSGCD